MIRPIFSSLMLALVALLITACQPDPMAVTEVALNTNPRPAAVQANQLAQQVTFNSSDKQILFGDLHVHTTYSMDAYEQGMSIMGGEGAHPPADACDFARYCAQLDFWSSNDCGGSAKVIACIEDQDIIDRILAHLREKEQEAPARPLLVPPTRAPPASLSLFAGSESTTPNQ